ncbi:HAD-IA family hydrolase [Rhizobiales bacterium RZME27]|uniref:HAD-IA family hydrolase n=1 Tax=Endobacterium cereale TaxID=2663029 RepID=A0A6A8ADL5_9HYPH|nr:HAD family hydrolase [Endobacterium cereale]MEB2845527.1 HAD family hydrolase [Endobacterium cereale]MQY48844.1 HAD-IA family hydrolase [Endobacterium cereale]
MNDRPLVIFDCDGVLVDSEPVSVRVLVTALNRHGIDMAEEEAYTRFLGRSLATMTQVMDEEYGFHTGPEFLEGLRVDLYERFKTELQAISGIADTVDRLGCAHCVASSSQPERIRLSLSLTGLIEKFEPNIFSASMVENGKPAPDLFLHAAEKMGYDPANCIVVEDSPAGIEAAQRAGMTALAFTGGSHTHIAGYRERIEELQPDAIFDAMPDLLHLVQKYSDGRKGPAVSRSI